MNRVKAARAETVGTDIVMIGLLEMDGDGGRDQPLNGAAATAATWGWGLTAVPADVNSETAMNRVRAARAETVRTGSTWLKSP